MYKQLLVLTTDPDLAVALQNERGSPFECLSHISDAGRAGAWVVAEQGLWSFTAAQAILAVHNTFTAAWCTSPADPINKIADNAYFDKSPHNFLRLLRGMWDPALRTVEHLSIDRVAAVQTYLTAVQHRALGRKAVSTDLTWGPNALIAGMTVSYMVAEIAGMEDIPRDLALGLVHTESGFDPTALNSSGAAGLTQLMPSTAAELGVNPFDPVSSLHGGFKYLRRQYDRFGNWISALAAYHSGPGSYIHRGITASDHEYIDRIERARQLYKPTFVKQLVDGLTH